jgi:hypothetical protein
MSLRRGSGWVGVETCADFWGGAFATGGDGCGAVDELSREITPVGRASVPDTVKAELLREIRDWMRPQK